jgi:hypothetical protein
LVDDFDRAPAAVAALAVVHAETGNADAARRVLADAAATGFDFPVDEDWIIAMTSFAWTAITCRAAQYAQPPFDDLNPFAALVAWDDGVPLGPVSGYLGGLATLLGRFDEADAYFTQAVEMSHRLEAKFFTAIANLWWAPMLNERGAPGDVEKPGTFSSKRTPPRRRRGTRTSSAAPPMHSYLWADRGQQPWA